MHYLINFQDDLTPKQINNIWVIYRLLYIIIYVKMNAKSLAEVYTYKVKQIVGLELE